MKTPNYEFERRRREQAKKQKQEEKRLRKAHAREKSLQEAPPGPKVEGGAGVPPQGGIPSAEG